MNIVLVITVIDVVVGLVMARRWIRSLFMVVEPPGGRPEGGTDPEIDCTPILPGDPEDIPITHDWDAELEELVASYAHAGYTV